jgi:hypothetical protein
MPASGLFSFKIGIPAMDIIVRTPAEIKKRESYFDPFIKGTVDP